MSIQASLDYEAVNRIEQWVQRLECVGYQIEQAIGKMQPCQKTNANAGTGATAVQHGSTTTTLQSTDAQIQGRDSTFAAPPSEPEAVKSARRMLAGGDVDFGEVTVSGLVTAYDTLSARLKRAEELLGQISNDFLGDHFGDYLNIVDAFLAGKEPT